MNTKQCYDKLGGDYEDLSGRIPDDALITRFLCGFLKDPSFQTLNEQIECGNRDKAFCAAYTLKGICANLSLTTLYVSVSALTEELRTTNNVSESAMTLFRKVRQDYTEIIDVIREFLNRNT